MKVSKWDDDLAVVLPQDLIDRLALEEGDEIEIVAAGGSATTAQTKDQGDSPRENLPR
ncbi:AbrB/MazE/SpoVT family DNA-binding domain-containing protein [Bradyrhizobium sp. UNPF46]|uniref:AbrB/MazE/SpoVT family DNA-binding domain-containing protein n=1 Tax=Bradyrhizobium sp. UNPF46 TaxID=1141168 RepID=UPI001152F2D8|nr:AbrB/MazE/SpoVT family DNA-binding domain-containing protein [Bradyrhizobium sp. UNPF46]